MRRHHSPRRTSSFKPQVEALEDRCTPAVSASLVGGVLTVTGDSNANNVIIEQHDGADTFKVKVGSGRVSVTIFNGKSSDVHTVNADLKGGSDTITYGLASGQSLTRSKDVNLTLGGEHDTAYLNFFAPGAWLFADLDVHVQGALGVDRLYANFGHQIGSSIGLAAEMGGGDDEVELTVRGYMSNGADAAFSLWGGAGDDRIVTDWNYGVTPGDLYHDCRATFDIRGEAGEDTIYTWFKGQVQGELSLVTWGGSEDDTISTIANFVDSSSTGDAEVKTYGEGGNDTLTQYVYNASWLSSLINTLNGGSGTDSASVTSNVKVFFVP